MRKGSTIELSQLPPPALIDALDAESYVAAALADFRLRYPDFTAVLESEPALKLIEALAYRETLLRNRVNKAALATMLAFAIDADLDQVGIRFGAVRMVAPATGDTPALIEDDERFRRRIQLAPEAFSVAGPVGAYEYWALTHDLSIADVHAYVPAGGQPNGEINVVVAGVNGAQVSDAVWASLYQLYARENVVPATDVVNVRRAERLDYTIVANLVVARGPDPFMVKAEAARRLTAYAAERYRIGAEVFRSGLYAALKVGGVENVELAMPASDIACNDEQIPYLTNLTLTTTVI